MRDWNVAQLYKVLKCSNCRQCLWKQLIKMSNKNACECTEMMVNKYKNKIFKCYIFVKRTHPFSCLYQGSIGDPAFLALSI